MFKVWLAMTGVMMVGVLLLGVYMLSHPSTNNGIAGASGTSSLTDVEGNHYHIHDEQDQHPLDQQEDQHPLESGAIRAP